MSRCGLGGEAHSEVKASVGTLVTGVTIYGIVLLLIAAIPTYVLAVRIPLDHHVGQDSAPFAPR